MKKRNKKKTLPNSYSFSQKSRRDIELGDHGRLLSLRPGVVMKSKKDYNRKWKLSDYE